MAQLSPDEFEALWAAAQNAPAVQPAAVKPIQIDFSLTTVLENYGTMASGFLASGEISQAQHDNLMAAIASCQASLAAINERDLIAKQSAGRLEALQQQVHDQLAQLQQP